MFRMRRSRSTTSQRVTVASLLAWDEVTSSSIMRIFDPFLLTMSRSSSALPTPTPYSDFTTRFCVIMPTTV